MIRFSSKKNPLGLELGERVKVKAYSEIEYWENDEKTLMRMEFKVDTSAIVIGCRVKATGKYIRPSGGNSFSWENDYVPAYLKVDKYIRFYECRKTLDGPSFLVLPDDIEAEDDNIN